MMREYGRAMTTVVSAYVGPAMTDYLQRLEGGIPGRWDYLSDPRDGVKWRSHAAGIGISVGRPHS